jgi:hypothetical protein
MAAPPASVITNGHTTLHPGMLTDLEPTAARSHARYLLARRLALEIEKLLGGEHETRDRYNARLASGLARSLNDVLDALVSDGGRTPDGSR